MGFEKIYQLDRERMELLTKESEKGVSKESSTTKVKKKKK